MRKEAHEARGTFWLQHWRECEAGGEGMAAYARRHDLNADEGYRWRRILQRSQRWPGAKPTTGEGASAMVARPSAPRFARVRIASPSPAGQSWPLRLQLLLSNGRRADLIVEDAQQLPRVLALLERAG